MDRLVKQGSVTLVYYGRQLLGSVENRASYMSRGVKKWHAKHDGIFGLFGTRKEAITWLWELHHNPKAASKLKELKLFGDLVDNDNGLYDVLRSFTESLGYTFIDEPLEGVKASKALGGMIWFNERKVYINECRLRTERCLTLAHELTHHYSELLFPRLKFKESEQIAEAVATAILFDYDIDVRHQGMSYVYYHSTARTAFMTGKLDKEFIDCYNRFSEDLKNFLERG